MSCVANKKNRLHTARTCVIYMARTVFLYAKRNEHAAITWNITRSHGPLCGLPLAAWTCFCASAARLREGARPWPIPRPPGLALRAIRPTPRTRCITRTNVADAGLPFLAAHPGNQMESTLSIARVVNQVPCSMKTKTPKKFSYRG